MKNMSLKLNKIILFVCELVIGILLFVNPVGFTNAIITVLGLVMLIAGIMSVLSYFKMSPANAALEKGLSNGLLEILAGGFLIFKGDWLIGVFPVLTVLYGVLTLVTGVTKVQWTVDLVRMKKDKWAYTAISAALTLICSIVILCNPFSTTAFLWKFIAITLIVEAVVDLVAGIFSKE